MMFNQITTTEQLRWKPKSKILREKRLINKAMNKRQEELFESNFKGFFASIAFYSTKEKTE